MRTFLFSHVFAAPFFLGFTALYFVTSFWPIGVIPMFFYMVYPHYGVLGFSIITIMDEDFLNDGALLIDKSIRWFMFSGLILSGFFYITISIYIDYYRNKLPSKTEADKNSKNTHEKIKVHEIEVINEKEVLEEEEAAKNQNPEIPI